MKESLLSIVEPIFFGSQDGKLRVKATSYMCYHPEFQKAKPECWSTEPQTRSGAPTEPRSAG